MAPGSSTCLSSEPCCLNQGFCWWLLLPRLLFCQLFLCISAAKREKKKQVYEQMCVSACMHVLFCLLLHSFLMLGARQVDDPTGVLTRATTASLTSKGCLQVETAMKPQASGATSLAAVLTSQLTPGLPICRPLVP